MSEVEAFIARHGVTKCPTVALLPTQATFHSDLSDHQTPDVRAFNKRRAIAIEVNRRTGKRIQRAQASYAARMKRIP